MGISSFFDLKKVLFLPYLPSKLSWIAEIKYVHSRCAFGRSRLFNSVSFPHSPQEVIVWSGFLIFLSLFIA